jgi:hypothetical protein
MRFRVSESESAEIRGAAQRNGITYSAFVVKASVVTARGGFPVTDVPIRALLGALMEHNRHARAVGVNLNQALKKLHSTGQFSEDLIQYAKVAARVLECGERAARDVEEWLNRQ